MSHDDQRNTLIVELTGHSNQSNYQSFDDATLAGMGAVLVFLREAKIRNDQDLKTMSADDQRNTLIVELAAQTHLSGPVLQGMDNMNLVLLGLGKDPSSNQQPNEPPLPETVTLDSGSITSGLSIGGSARLVMARGGETTFTGHLHDSGALGIDYLLTVIALTPSGTAYTVQRQGHTAGTLTPGSRDDDWTQTGVNDKIRDNWREASKAKMSWTLHANDTLTPQLGKALEDALQDALKQAGQAAVKAVIALF
jgi:hypothetical protein